MLVHVALYFLPEALQLGMLLLKLFLFRLKHGDHIKPNLNFLSLRQFELMLALLRS